MVLTDTATTAPHFAATGRRLVNATVGAVDAAGRWYDRSNTGAWGNPADACRWAGHLACHNRRAYVVQIRDVETGEEFYVTVAPRFVLVSNAERPNGLAAEWSIIDTADGFRIPGPLAPAEEIRPIAAGLNAGAIEAVGVWNPRTRATG